MVEQILPTVLLISIVALGAVAFDYGRVWERIRHADQMVEDLDRKILAAQIVIASDIRR